MKYYAFKLIWSLLMLTPFSLLGQTYYTVSSGTWGPGGTSNLFNTSPIGPGSLDGDNASDISYTIVVQSGHILTLSDDVTCKQLRIESGAQVIGGTPANGETNEIVIGDTLRVDGELGTGLPSSPGSQDRIGITGGAISVFKEIIGNGTITLHQLSSDFNTVRIQKDITVYNYDNGAYGTALYTKDNSTIVVFPGVTVDVYGYLSIDGKNGIDGDINSSGSILTQGIIDIKEGGLYLKSDDFNTFSNFGAYQIFPGGFIILNDNPIIGTGALNDPNPTGGANAARIINEGTLELSSSKPVLYGDLARSYIENKTGSEVHFKGSGVQTIGNHFLNGVFEKLYIEGSGVKVLNTDIEVKNNLYLNSSLLSLTDYNLFSSKSKQTAGPIRAFQNSSINSYIVTGGSGKVSMVMPRNNSNAPDTIPVGNGNISPVLVANSTNTIDTFSFRVGVKVLENGYSGDPFISDVVQKTWFIEENTPGGQDIEIILNWNTTDQLPGFDIFACWVSHYTNEAWDVQTPSTISSGPYTGYLSMSRSGLNSFSPFSVMSSNPLPVTLTSFSAHYQEPYSILNWSTATELNNDFFIIDHCTDGHNFNEIGRVKGKGTTTTPQFYQLKQLKPAKGINYYRLKQVDFDGTVHKSKVISLNVNSNKGESIRILPTIIDHAATLKLSSSLSSPIKAQIVNTNGSIARKIIIPAHQTNVNLNLNDLPSGNYWLKIINQMPIPFVKK